MTDKEITEIIATKVMGWDESWKPKQWEIAQGYWPFSPLELDDECMKAWDKFAEKHPCCTLYHGQGAGGLWMACPNDEDEDDNVCGLNADRRRAMCECMAKAVSNGN